MSCDIFLVRTHYNNPGNGAIGVKVATLTADKVKGVKAGGGGGQGVVSVT